MSKQQKTLAAVFAEPARSSVRWRDVESLLRHHGAVITEGEGSRIRVLLNGVKAVFHRPHPPPHTDKGALRSVRRLLTEAGITP
ncbi:MAG: type II toxin-antitoxin system HicA family toxin [Pirellulaceae bacterium]